MTSTQSEEGELINNIREERLKKVERMNLGESELQFLSDEVDKLASAVKTFHSLTHFWWTLRHSQNIITRTVDQPKISRMERSTLKIYVPKMREVRYQIHKAKEQHNTVLQELPEEPTDLSQYPKAELQVLLLSLTKNPRYSEYLQIDVAKIRKDGNLAKLTKKMMNYVQSAEEMVLSTAQMTWGTTQPEI